MAQPETKVQATDVFDLRYRSAKIKWAEISARYLPVLPTDSFWRFSRLIRDTDLDQGWKLHVSASILKATEILERIGPILSRHDVLFKAPRTLRELDRLNSGIFYGYSQVGKFITVYPNSTRQAVSLAAKLHNVTRQMEAPAVPFDFRYRPGSNVFYRYGAFKSFETSSREVEYVIRDPNGILVPDERSSITKPHWLSDPFQTNRKTIQKATPTSLLQTTFRVFRALSQRGKGGVYQGLDVSVMPPRLCLIKEGRKNGEVEWDGRDGAWRIKHEGRVLAELSSRGVNVPLVYGSFEVDRNQYLATEWITGEDLESWLTKKSRRMSIRAGLRLCIRAADLMASIHNAGWVWRDCKPRNILRRRDGELVPVDFEGACTLTDPDPSPYGTAANLPPEWDRVFTGQSREPEDLYALGVMIYLIFAGRPANPDTPESLKKLRNNVPEAISTLTRRLLSAEPQARPPANQVTKQLKRILRGLK